MSRSAARRPSLARRPQAKRRFAVRQLSCHPPGWTMACIHQSPGKVRRDRALPGSAIGLKTMAPLTYCNAICYGLAIPGQELRSHGGTQFSDKTDEKPPTGATGEPAPQRRQHRVELRTMMNPDRPPCIPQRPTARNRILRQADPSPRRHTPIRTCPDPLRVPRRDRTSRQHPGDYHTTRPMSQPSAAVAHLSHHPFPSYFIDAIAS